MLTAQQRYDRVEQIAHSIRDQLRCARTYLQLITDDMLYDRQGAIHLERLEYAIEIPGLMHQMRHDLDLALMDLLDVIEPESHKNVINNYSGISENWNAMERLLAPLTAGGDVYARCLHLRALQATKERSSSA